MLFDLANLPYWIVLGSGILLFVFVIISGGTDSDAEIEADADLDADGFDFSQVLGWLGIGRAPLILLLAVDFSLWGMLGWMMNISLGSLLGIMPGGALSGMVLIISLVLALYLGRLIALPLEKIFALFGEDVSSDRLIGCIGTVSSAVIPYAKASRIGQVSVVDAAHNLVSVNAALPDWATMVPQLGETVVVIDHLPEYYVVIAQAGPDEEAWLRQSTQSRR